MIHFFFFASDMQNMQIIQHTTASSAMIFKNFHRVLTTIHANKF